MNAILTVRLECDDGEYVADVVVPLTTPMPSVLVWGERCFRLWEELSYREVSSFTIPLEAVR